MKEKQEFTQLLKKAQNGDRGSLDELLPLIYDELRRVAANQLQRERENHTLQATALVHEAYLRLLEQREVDWQNRAHFFSIAAEMMRRILAETRAGRGTALARRSDQFFGRKGFRSGLARRRAQRARRIRRDPGADRRAPVFRRSDDRRNGRSSANFRFDRQTRVADGESVAQSAALIQLRITNYELKTIRNHP
jgi:hypothetical protein